MCSSHKINFLKTSYLKVHFQSVLLALFTPSQLNPLKKLSHEKHKQKGLSLLKSISLIIGAGFFIALFSVLWAVPALASDDVPPAPTLISITEGSKTANFRPVITGLTVNGSQVEVFIDDQFNGSAIVRDHESGTANFYYYPVASLKPGLHTLSVRAKKGANFSPDTRVSFEIVGFSIPTLFTPVFNLQTTEFRPFIVGLVNNNSKVKIYLDGQYEGEIWVKNHPSGTANFAYKPKSDLSLGSHNVRAIAVNWQTGQESKMSSMVTFQVKTPYPAPTLFTPTASGASWYRPNIIGLAKNGLYVDIYINDIPHRVNLEDHPSGTTSFTFRPEENLSEGLNVIFAVAYSRDSKMSRKSNIIYWKLGEPSAEESVSVEGVRTEELETPEVSGTKPVETGIEVEKEDRSGKAQVTIEEEGVVKEEGVVEPQVSGEAEQAAEEAEAGELESETNWSKIIGLVILAILIIVLIIQLLKKEEPEDKKGETLKLFEEGKKDESKKKNGSKTEAKKETKKKEEKSEDKKSDIDLNDIPPPPPPSSNLPF